MGEENSENKAVVVKSNDGKRFLDDMANEYGVSRDALWSLAKLYITPSSNGIAPTSEHLYMYLLFCNRNGLDPTSGQAFGFIDKDGRLHTGVTTDGWLAIGNRHPAFDGIEVKDTHDEGGKLISCTGVVWRKDRTHPFEITEYMEECYRQTKEGHWDKRPHRMLRHKAATQALRYAFALSGVHDIEEAKEAAQIEESHGEAMGALHPGETRTGWIKRQLSGQVEEAEGAEVERGTIEGELVAMGEDVPEKGTIAPKTGTDTAGAEAVKTPRRKGKEKKPEAKAPARDFELRTPSDADRDEGCRAFVVKDEIPMATIFDVGDGVECDCGKKDCEHLKAWRGKNG